ncbi:MAG TPA: hypothetical protein VLJ59_14500 [Mycobacteriales bacterium]|nr:hypothetical protein [Mycobacteriales bacterium]
MTAGPPSLADLLATWQQWSHTDTLRTTLTNAQRSGNTSAAQMLAQALDDHEPHVDALTALAANHELITLLSGWQWHAIRDAREHGATWQQIAQALGTTPEQAHTGYLARIEEAERYASPHNDTTRHRTAAGHTPA